MKIAIGYNTAHYVWMFRKKLIHRLISIGHQVVVIAPMDEYAGKLESIGVKFIDLPMLMNANPISDFSIFIKFLNILSREDVDVFLGYTVKPNIYGSLAAQLLGVKIVNNISGLGTLFTNESRLLRLVEFLYRVALSRSYRVFFQNPDDMSLFIDKNIVKHKNIDLLPGSGVDLQKYVPVVVEKTEGSFKFLLIARILRDKGILEYIEAAKIIRSRNENICFQLLGPIGGQNPTAISQDQVNDWVGEGVIEYLGVSVDVRDEISKVDCVVLPSYREGVPKTLLEAAAMGKPIITTNVAGCKEVVDHGVNGFLCNVHDAVDLAEKMIEISTIPLIRLQQMGSKSREKVERQFDEEIVIGKYLEVIESCSHGR